MTAPGSKLASAPPSTIVTRSTWAGARACSNPKRRDRATRPRRSTHSGLGQRRGRPGPVRSGQRPPARQPRRRTRQRAGNEPGPHPCHPRKAHGSHCRGRHPARSAARGRAPRPPGLVWNCVNGATDRPRPGCKVEPSLRRPLRCTASSRLRPGGGGVGGGAAGLQSPTAAPVRRPALGAAGKAAPEIVQAPPPTTVAAQDVMPVGARGGSRKTSLIHRTRGAVRPRRRMACMLSHACRVKAVPATSDPRH